MPADALPPCPLCGRPLVPGASVNAHHLVPKAYGGRVAEPVHRVCHDKIHAVLSEKELRDAYASWEALRAHREIARFVAWVRRKHPEFVDTSAGPRRPSDR
jgi:hypothetical protein